jgi:hypothetical protein
MPKWEALGPCASFRQSKVTCHPSTTPSPSNPGTSDKVSYFLVLRFKLSLRNSPRTINLGTSADALINPDQATP